MDPITLTLGAIAASMVAKSVERAEDGALDAAQDAVARLVGWLKHKFGAESVAVANVEEVPDSPTRVKALAALIDEKAGDSDFRTELESLVEQVSQAGVDMGNVFQSIWGNQNVQLSGVANSSININYGSHDGGGAAT